jgi:hypothetical protein
MKYDKRMFTWGYEIEWGDITRNIKIPKNLGKWEHHETDIVNIHGKYRGRGSDPLGIDPPVGGEINTVATKTWQEQVDRIFEIYDLFVKNGDNPSSACVNHGHIHVHIPGLIDDIESLKKLVKYIQKNQKITIEKCYRFKEYPEMEIPGIGDYSRSYSKFDCGIGMPDDMCNNIINMANNFDDFIKLLNPKYYYPKLPEHIWIESVKSSQESENDILNKVGHPHYYRYAINTLSLKYNKTIEFRCFRSTINRKELSDSFKFVENFLDSALNDGPDVEEILKDYSYTFPEFNYDYEIFRLWEKTKYFSVLRKRKKQRTFYEIDQI